MKNFKSLLAILFFLLTGSKGSAQTVKTIDSLQVQYQSCLDKGAYMLGCAGVFYAQMDSLLNTRYRKIYAACDSVQKHNLTTEQLNWLKTRDKQFRNNQRKVAIDAKKNGYDGGQDEKMILTDMNAMLVKKRLIKLIKSSPMNYSPGKYKATK